MIEPGYTTPVSPIRQDLNDLQQRASYQRRRYRNLNRTVVEARNAVAALFATPLRTVRKLPPRYILHGVVSLLVPLALGFSQLSTVPWIQPSPTQATWYAENPAELGPISVQSPDGEMIAGDPPLADEDIPMPISVVSKREALAPVVVSAQVSFETIKLRNGPGLEYDDVARASEGTQLQVVGRYGEWLQVREHEGSQIYWVASELIDIPATALYALFEIPQEDVPPPPPPKIAKIREDRLNLRDGPGTNYVSMEKLESGDTVSLVEQYQDWFHVASDDFDGWVKADFLDIAPGVVERVHIADEIPDPNPSLVASVNASSVNLRGGPGKEYPKQGKVNTNTQVDLLARHKDWFRVQTSDGTKAWVFSDLLNMSPMVRRRIPYTNDIPAVPAPVRVARATGGGTAAATTSSSSSSSGSRTVAVQSQSSNTVQRQSTAAHVPASGDVAGYAMRFVGYRYVYGGASPGSGFDCSGLTQYVYRQYGVYLPHNAAAQYSTAYGAIVGGMSNLAPGDLMFFAGTAGPGISHVSIYIGGGQMVHAMTPRLGVGVSSIWESYWVRHYYGAIRVRR